MSSSSSDDDATSTEPFPEYYEASDYETAAAVQNLILSEESDHDGTASVGPSNGDTVTLIRLLGDLRNVTDERNLLRRAVDAARTERDLLRQGLHEARTERDAACTEREQLREELHEAYEEREHLRTNARRSMYNFAAERRDLHALLDQSAKASITNKRKALYFGDLANRLREELEEVKKRAVEKDSGAGVKREVGDVEKEPENQEGEEGDGAKKLN